MSYWQSTLKHLKPRRRNWCQQSVQSAPVVWEPAGKQVLVLAPHMDDEIIGCGGTLAKHVADGARVVVVFLTDGRQGGARVQELEGEARTRAQIDLVQTRKAEAQCALASLRIQNVKFLDSLDGSLASTPELVSQLSAILDDTCPDLIYLPHFLEAHPDHRAANRLLLKAAGGVRQPCDCLAYEVWTPLWPNCLVEITDTIQIKRQALEHYQSQLADRDYVRAICGLNAYRSLLLPDRSSGYVEAFWRAPLPLYLQVYRANQ